MYIKQVIIQGFKSYRERIVIEPFDPRVNVIVGRNGSGKSNFFSAIQFVLSDEYSYMTQEQRQSLLHEGLGPRTMTAYVEIIFDNSCGRLPFDGSEVHLRRTIGTKKDTYFLNKTFLPRSEVMTILESAGFSKSNPYYIVKQGEINQMAIATDAQRLKLLREIAGTRVYDERKEESRAILEETEAKIEKAYEYLETMEERFRALQEEKETLKEYQRWDKQRRCLEFTIYQRESKETKQKLQDLKDSYAESVAERQKLDLFAKTVQENICTAEERWKIALDEVENCKRREEVRSEELHQLIQKATKLSLMIDEAQEEINNNEEEKRGVEVKLENLQRNIEEKSKELEAVVPKYRKLLKEEEEINLSLNLKDQSRKELYVKQGQLPQFRSKETRDDFITEQLTQLAKQIKSKEIHLLELKQNSLRDEEKQKTLENTIEVHKAEMEAQKKSIEKTEEQRYKENEKKEETNADLKALYRQESFLQAKLVSEKENLYKADRNLSFSVGRSIMNGCDSVRKVLQAFRETPRTSQERHFYRGKLIDNFTCDKGAFTAVEVIAGKRLFYHIVETEAFATSIIKEMNKLQLPGEANFMPLSRLKVSKPVYPATEDAIPMISKLNYEPEYEKVMRFVFGRTLICRTLEVGTKLARETGLDCVTTDGDLVSSKGFLTGGYSNRDRGSFVDYENRRNICWKIEELESELLLVKKNIGDVTQKLISHLDRIQKADALIRKSKDNYNKMEADIQAIKIELSSLKSCKRRSLAEKSIVHCSSSLEALKASRASWERDLSENFPRRHPKIDQEMLSRLNDEIRSLSKRSKEVLDKRLELEMEKTKLEDLLMNNLTRRKEELTEALLKLSEENRKRKIDSLVTELNDVKERTRIVETKIKEESARLQTCVQELQSQSEELEKWKMSKKDVMEKLEEIAKVLGRFTSKRNIYEEKIPEIEQKIRDLGTLPNPETYNKFNTMTNKALFKELETTNLQLKQYSHINKKALDQFIVFSELRESLLKRKDELDRGSEKIQLLMATLEQQKHEAIRFTFKQVSKYFREVFEKFVPFGHGELVMKTASDEQSASTESSSTESEVFEGVVIRVNFGGRTSETNEMNQLSGGQKSLVALALIFAIQKCDPAPFYLFDEIDQSLDPQYRRSVAAMILELSSDAQFITTTFRPELLRCADKFYGVTYGNKVSHIECVTLEEAEDFVEGNSGNEL